MCKKAITAKKNFGLHLTQLESEFGYQPFPMKIFIKKYKIDKLIMSKTRLQYLDLCSIS